MKSMTIKSAGLLLGVLAITFTLYSDALRNEFVWDDWQLFVHSPNLRSDSLTWANLSAPVLEGSSYFRPFALFSFAAEFRLAGVHSAISHGVNLALHLCNITLLFCLARRVFAWAGLTANDYRAGAAALIYGIHPSIVESVAWVSGRFDLLATLFVLTGLISDAFIRTRVLRVVALGASFALALGSKEVAIALPPALLIQRLIRDRVDGESLVASSLRILRQEWVSVLALAAVFAIYLVLRIDGVGQLLHINGSVAHAVTRSMTFPLLVLNTLAFYLRETFVPFQYLGPLHPIDVSALTAPANLLKAAMAGLALILLARGVMLRNAAALLALIALAALLPVLNIIPLTIGGSVGQDRFLTLPLVFGAMAVACARPLPLPAFRPAAQALALGLTGAVWMILAAASVRVTVPQWHSNLSLWTWVYRQYPDRSSAQGQFLSATLSAGRPDLAKVVFDKLRAKGPLEASTQLAYGSYLIVTGEIEDGKKYIEGALLAFPPLHTMTPERIASIPNAQIWRLELAHAYLAMAGADALAGNFESALANAEIANGYKPNLPIMMVPKSLNLLAVDRVQEADALFAKALDLTLPEQRPDVVALRQQFIDNLCTNYPERGASVCKK